MTLLAVCLLLLGVAAQAGADQPPRGTMDLYWNGCWAGPQDEIPDWTGTITFGGESYGMAFFNVGTGKPFDHATGMIGFFGEVWAIYETPIPRLNVGSTEDPFWCAGAVPALGNAVMWGYDTGAFNMSTFAYHMSGTVEAAVGPFAGSAVRSCT